MIWLDGLDIPMIRFFDAGFAENATAKSQAVSRAEGSSFARYGHNMAPVRHDAPFGLTSPIFSYPYDRSREALDRLERDAPVDDWDGVKLRYLNPLTGGSPMPTMATFMQKLPAGFSGKPWRQTDGAVYSVVEGDGEAVIESGGQSRRFAFSARAIISSFLHGTLRASSSQRGLCAVQLFRSPGAPGTGHSPRRKVVMSYVFTPPPAASVPVRRPRGALPGAPHLLRRAATTKSTPRKWASPAASRPSSSSSPPMRSCRCNAGETGTMAYPSLTKNLHHEIELVVAIGTGGKNIKAADAQKHIYGYAVGLDMTRRDLQGEMKKQGRPWCIGKAFEQSAPIGPITPADTGRRRRPRPRSTCRSTARTASAATCPS